MDMQNCTSVFSNKECHLTSLPVSPQRFLLLCQPADDLPSNPKRPPARVTNGTAAAYTELKPLSNTGELSEHRHVV